MTNHEILFQEPIQDRITSIEAQMENLIVECSVYILSAFCFKEYYEYFLKAKDSGIEFKNLSELASSLLNATVIRVKEKDEEDYQKMITNLTNYLETLASSGR